MSTPSETTAPPSLEQLLRRSDVWRGDSQRFAPRIALDSGYPALNAALLNKGWPLGSLIEVCQQQPNHSEWLLFTPALLHTPGGYLVLLNPPAIPFAQGLIQAGIDLERVLVIRSGNKADFLASFTELARTPACNALLAWQPASGLSYTELRKCLLAAADGRGLYIVFRPESARHQSSPATLRVLTEAQSAALTVNIFKQKGQLQQSRAHTLKLPIPDAWQELLPHRHLDKDADEAFAGYL